MKKTALRLTGFVLVAGAIAHLVAIPLGPDAYEFLGAPAGLVQMASVGHPRAAITCVVIATFLLVLAAYAFSAAGAIARLPLLRTVLALAGAGLVVRGLAFVPLILWRPEVLGGLCGRCQGIDWFVIGTSVLCLLLGIGLLSGVRGDSAQPR